MDFFHEPVLLAKSIDGLNVKKSGIYVDGTAGGGGHSEEILNILDTGKLISIDQDPDAIAFLKKKFADYKNSILVKGNFSDIDKILKDLSISLVDGILLDIGVSSYQLDCPKRGFSYNYNAPLDMRMSKLGVTAADLVNTLSLCELDKILREYGEEKFAKNIAINIVKERQKSYIKTTFQLVDIIKSALPAKILRKSGHPARKTFQALRIAVNDELGVLERFLDMALSVLDSGGRLAVITFHSLEDKIVKNKMISWVNVCTCPPDFPVCVCGNYPKAKLINRKAITPSIEEIKMNPRSRSAKLRICEKL